MKDNKYTQDEEVDILLNYLPPRSDWQPEILINKLGGLSVFLLPYSSFILLILFRWGAFILSSATLHLVSVTWCFTNPRQIPQNSVEYDVSNSTRLLTHATCKLDTFLLLLRSHFLPAVTRDKKAFS